MGSGRLKARLDRNEVACGAWLGLTGLFSVEIMGLTGFDWLLVDAEHCAISIAELRGMIPALEATGAASVVRVPDRGEYWIKQALDLGADGVMVPRIDNPELARQAVRQAKYHPLGERGFGPARAIRYGHDVSYVDSANVNTLLIAQLEHRSALDNIDEIMEVEGIDAYFIGTGDLSQSMGHLGHPECDEVREAAGRLILKLSQHGKAWGASSSDPDDFRHYVAAGARLMTLGSDLVYLRDAARQALEQMRSAVKVPRADAR